MDDDRRRTRRVRRNPDSRSQPPRRVRKRGGGGRMRAPRRRGMTVTAISVLVAFCIFIFVFILSRAGDMILNTHVDTMPIRLGNVGAMQSVQGMIIRYETVFRANRDGRVVFAVDEFERVREGVPVASVRDVDAVYRTEEEMSRLMRQVMEQHEMRHDTLSAPRIERLNTSLHNRATANLHIYMQMDLSEIYNLHETLMQITENRNRVMVEESVHIRADLNRRHDALNIRLDEYSENIYATHTGIMSPFVDGFEEQFTPQNMRDLSREQIRMSVEHDVILPGREVSEGEEVFKIVGNTWYVATWMPPNMAHGFNVGDYRTIYLENAGTGQFEPIVMRVYYMNYHTRDVYVILRSTRHGLEFLDQRNVNLRVTENIERGFIIPSSAIATRRFFRIYYTHLHGEEDNYFIRHRRDDGSMYPIPVRVYEYREHYALALAEHISLVTGEVIMPVDPTHMVHLIRDDDIVIVRGVYDATLNYARFVEIDMDGETLDGGTIMLNPDRNPRLVQFASIVTDASTVRQGQVLLR